MGTFSDVLKKMAGFLADSESHPGGKSKPGIQELAVKRLQALQSRWEMVEAQVRLAAQNRRDLQKLVAEAKAVEAIGKQAMVSGDARKAEAAMARYGIMQQTIAQMVQAARTSDEQATEALHGFKAEAQAAQRAASEAKALAQLEHVIELQKKHQALAMTQSTAADEFEAARDELLLSASIQAATQSVQIGQDDLSGEVAAAQKSAEIEAVRERWQKELTETGEAGSAGSTFTLTGDDPAESAIEFLEKPPLGGLLGPGSPKRR